MLPQDCQRDLIRPGLCLGCWSWWGGVDRWARFDGVVFLHGGESLVEAGGGQWVLSDEWGLVLDGDFAEDVVVIYPHNNGPSGLGGGCEFGAHFTASSYLP